MQKLSKSTFEFWKIPHLNICFKGKEIYSEGQKQAPAVDLTVVKQKGHFLVEIGIDS